MRTLKCECCGESFETSGRMLKLCPACRNYKTAKSVYREGTRPRDQVGGKPARPVKKDKPNITQCRTCRYSAKYSDFSGAVLCDYIGVTGHRRPCEPSPNCTVYEKGKEIRKWKMY